MFGDLVNGAKGLFGMGNSQPASHPSPQIPLEEEETDEASDNLGVQQGGRRRRRRSRKKRRKSRKSRKSRRRRTRSKTRRRKRRR